MTPIQFKQRVRKAFGNSWALVIGYVVISATINTLGKTAERKLLAKAIADEIESRDWGIETDIYTEIMDDDDVLDDMVAFTDNQGNDWYKNVDGDWVNLDV